MLNCYQLVPFFDVLSCDKITAHGGAWKTSDHVKNCLIMCLNYQNSSQRSHLSFVNLPELKIISSKTVPWSFCKAWKCELISRPWFPDVVSPYLGPIRTNQMCYKSSNKMYICLIQTTYSDPDVISVNYGVHHFIQNFKVNSHTGRGFHCIDTFQCFDFKYLFCNWVTLWNEFILNNNRVWCDITLYYIIHHVMFWIFFFC